MILPSVPVSSCEKVSSYRHQQNILESVLPKLDIKCAIGRLISGAGTYPPFSPPVPFSHTRRDKLTSIITHIAVPKKSEYFYQPVLLEVAISDIAQSRVDIRGQSNVQYIVLSTAAESLEPAL